MEKKVTRLATFNVGDTLLVPSRHSGDETSSALSRLHEHDTILTFATGRRVLEIHRILGSISLDAFSIVGNGTHIHSVGGDVLHRQDPDLSVADTALHQG